MNFCVFTVVLWLLISTVILFSETNAQLLFFLQPVDCAHLLEIKIFPDQVNQSFV